FLNALRIALRQKEQVELEATELTNILKNESDFVVFLKGAAYSLSDAKVGQGRLYSDIDILVNKNQITQCEQALSLFGWVGEAVNDYDDKYYRKWAHEIPPMAHAHRGTIIDVHHNIVPIISKDAPTVENLAAYIVRNKFGVHVLNEAAQFVHCSVHLFRNEEYRSAFRDLLDLFYMLEDASGEFIDEIIATAEALGFVYEVGLALWALHYHFSLNISEAQLNKCDVKRALRSGFDHYLFASVLLPQHTLLAGSKTPLKHLLAMLRGHVIKMPIHLLCYHLVVKSLRSVIEMLFGKHVFTPTTELPQDNTQK
ncbi:MAG: nucleotidyltransferase family protein, partial [Glaciecola sp.]